MDKGICKGCGAKIGWVIMTSGKRMPINLPAKKVIQDWLHDGTVYVIEEGYEPHWVTCARADEFRRKGDEANKV